jgi:hypothetical protein
MTAVFKGLRYDTDTAEEVASHSYGYKTDFESVDESLYRTKNGRWFLAGSGGPKTRYAESVGTDGNGRIGGKGIVPITELEARDLLEAWEPDSEAFKFFDIKDA